MVSLSRTNSLGSFGLTLVWCRCVSQVLGAPLVSKCEIWGELRGYHLKAGLVDLLLGLRILILYVIYFPDLEFNYGMVVYI